MTRDLPLIAFAVIMIWLLFSAAGGARNIMHDDQEGRDPCVLTNTCRPLSP